MNLCLSFFKDMIFVKKKMKVVPYLKIFAFLLEFVSILSIYTVSFFLPMFQGFSIYGFFIFVYFLHQLIVSSKNHQQMKQLCHSSEIPPYRCALLIVGYRENENYWIQCLESVRTCLFTNSNIEYVIVVIDGYDPEDQYMKQIAENILCPLSSPSIDIISISHRGKRGCLYYGLEKVQRFFQSEIEKVTVVVSDSDTILESESIQRLHECLFLSSANNGCATGRLTIFNQSDGILAKIIHLRYQYAFCIERGTTSYYNCMTCCSGPLSVYKLSCLNECVLKRFVTQTVWETKCEPGDDRHLTNLILAQGYGAKQTNLALAQTEAPVSMIRFLRQQLRWSRSYYRELYWQLKALSSQSFFLGIVCLYETLFPFFVTFWMFHVLFISTLFYDFWMGILLSTTFLFVKNGILLFSMKDKRLISFLYQILYFFIYFTCLLPLKFYAILTLLNNKWVTVPHLYRSTWNISWDFIWIFLWNIIILWGIVTKCLSLFQIFLF